MPKERIKHATQYATWEAEGNDEYPGAQLSKALEPGEKAPVGSTITEDVSLDVSWNRDAEWVQVAIEMTPEKWKELSDIAQGDGIDHYSIYTDVLSRTEINKMIRTLRRARDAAYGADE